MGLEAVSGCLGPTYTETEQKKKKKNKTGYKTSSVNMAHVFCERSCSALARKKKKKKKEKRKSTKSSLTWLFKYRKGNRCWLAEVGWGVVLEA
jgi:Sec7-like guanine-nucleotide exchange factor